MPLSKAKKDDYYKKLVRLLTTYTKVFIVKVDNVGSQQMNLTRKEMRGTAEILMGKNTFIRKIIKDFLEKNPGHFYGNLLPLVGGNVGFVFTNADLPKVRDVILANKVPAPARIGAISPVDIVVPAGPTGADPGQTSFFQVLQIPTKIVKGQIEITSSVNLIRKGDKVGNSEFALLNKLGIKPFSYGLQIDSVFDSGSVFPVEVLDISHADLAAKFSSALSTFAAVSLALKYPTQASIPHSIANAFKTLVAITVNLEGYTFEKAEEYKKVLADPSAFLAAAASSSPAPSGGAPVPKVEEVAPPPKVEEEVDVSVNFGGASSY